MAEKLLLIHFGQSNDGPSGDYATFAAAHPEIDFTSTLFFPITTSIGAYGDKFQVPGNFPGFANPIDIRGRALNKVRYLTHYNPSCTGYHTYPCTGRTRTGTVAEPTLVLEQTFEAAAVTGGIVFTRFRDKTTHRVISCTPNAAGATVKIVPTAGITLSAVNTGTETLTLGSAHGWPTDTPVRLVAASGGTLPVAAPAIAEATTYYVRSPSGADLQLSLTPGGAAINFTGAHVGTVYVYRVADSWANPEVDEQYDYTIAGVTGTNPVVLPLGFGNMRDGTLVGLKLTCVAGTAGNLNVPRVIQSYNNRTREALLSSPLPSAIAATDVFTIAPQAGTFAQFALFLPWTPLEAGNVSGRPNPFPPGFNFPNHWHVPQLYHWSAGAGQGTVPARSAYHIALAVRLQEHFGQEILVVGGDVGGTSLVRSELAVGDASDVGWYDREQMSCWAPGEDNGCFQRLCDNVDAAISALAAEGHTARVVLVTYMQGETDALSDHGSKNYFGNCRTLFATIRSFLKSRGLWPGSAESIPIIHPQILEPEYGGAWPAADVVNEAKRRLASADRFTRTPVTNGLTQSAAHYTGKGNAELAQLIFETFREMSAANDQTGEVDICNAALSLIGDTAQVTSIDPEDGTPQSALCARFYARARDAVLESGQWGFAMRRVAGEPLDSPTENWGFAYRRPDDALKVVSVLPTGLGDDYPTVGAMPQYPRETMTEFLATGVAPASTSVTPYQYQQENAHDGVILLTNVEDAEIRYVARVTNTRTYPAIFVEAVAYRLASMLAGATISGDVGRAEAKRCLEMSVNLTARAGGVDLMQQHIDPPRMAPWHRYR